MTNTQISVSTPRNQAPRKNILPDLLELVTDLSKLRGYCWAGNERLGQMIAVRIGRSKPYTAQRIGQALRDLVALGQLVVEFVDKDRHLIPAKIETLSDLWTPADFQSIPTKFSYNKAEPELKEQKEKKNKQQSVVVPFDLNPILEILERLDISDDEFFDIVDRLPGYCDPEVKGLTLPDRVFTDRSQNQPQAPVDAPQASVSDPLPEPQPPVETEPQAILAPPQKPQDSPLVLKLIEKGVTASVAAKLVKDHGSEVVSQQVEWIEYRSPKDLAATLVSAIRDGWSRPRECVEQEVAKAKEIANIVSQVEGERIQCNAYWQGLNPVQREDHIATAKVYNIDWRNLVREKLGFEHLQQYRIN